MYRLSVMVWDSLLPLAVFDVLCVSVHNESTSNGSKAVHSGASLRHFKAFSDLSNDVTVPTRANCQ